MNWISDLSVLDTVLGSGIMWLSVVFIWLLKKFIESYNQNTRVMTDVSKTLVAMDQKLDNANSVDREILVELARLRNPLIAVQN